MVVLAGRKDTPLPLPSPSAGSSRRRGRVGGEEIPTYHIGETLEEEYLPVEAHLEPVAPAQGEKKGPERPGNGTSHL